MIDFGGWLNEERFIPGEPPADSAQDDGESEILH